jgi:beta-lactamase class A
MQDWQEQARTLLGSAQGRFGVYAAIPAVPLFQYQASSLFPSASTIKVLIMAELLRQVEAGLHSLAEHPILPTTPTGGCGILEFLSSEYHPDLMDLLHFMICSSDNKATNVLIRLTGMEAVNQLAVDIGMTSTRLHRFMMDTKYMQKGTDNTTSPADMGRFFQLLADNELVSNRASTTMKTILGRQQFADVMMLFLPEGIRAEHKTGGLPGSVLDVGLVYSAGDPIILCLMATQLANNGEGAATLGRVAAITYAAGKEEHII